MIDFIFSRKVPDPGWVPDPGRSRMVPDFPDTGYVPDGERIIRDPGNPGPSGIIYFNFFLK